MMPLKYFNCEVGKIPTGDCLKDCPSPNGRCLSLPTLHELAKPQDYLGTFTTKHLITPTRMEYLKITNDYAVDPKARAFALLGHFHNQKLDEMSKTIDKLREDWMLNEETKMIVNMLEPDGQRPGSFILWDNVTWGCYAVAMAMGLTLFNNKYSIRPEKADFKGVDLILNNYRCIAEALGLAISKIYIQATVRDGGTSLAKSRGITRRIYRIQVPIMDDTEVTQYFDDKAEALGSAIDANKLPPICSYNDRWGGKRCDSFCDVNTYCPR